MNVLKAFKLSAVAAVLVCTASAAFAAESEFSYAGYLRVGYAYTHGLYGYDGNFGLTGKDYGAQKWTGRLGKEANQQYLENTFMNTFTVEGGAWAKLFVTLTAEGYNPGSDAQNCAVGDGVWNSQDQKNTTADITMRNRQAYVEMGGLGFSPDTSFWVGRRFYHREDCHVLDFYYLDFSGDGAGIENIAGLGLSAAIISQQPNGSESKAISTDRSGHEKGIDTASTGVFQYKNKFMRVDYSYTYRPRNGDKNPARGQFVSLQYTPSKFFFILDGNSSVTFQYAKGASAENIWWGDRVTHIQDNESDVNRFAHAYNVIAHGLIQVSDEFSICPVGGFSLLHSTAGRVIGDSSALGNGDVYRIFAVVRPHFNITKNVAVEVEGGYYKLVASHPILGGAASAGWQSKMGLDKLQKSNWAMKVTPALVLTLDNGFWTRPALRLYANYEKTGKKVTSNTVQYSDNTSKKDLWSYGFQVEAWW